MTLKELRGKCLIEIQNFNPESLIPDLDGVVRESIRALISPLGGMQRSTTFDTVAGTREYGTSDGFPTDFLRMLTVYRDTTRLRPMYKRERNESTGQGGPSYYYIFSREIGFNVVPGSVYTMTLNYMGLGDDVITDSGVVLGELSIMDDDPAWKAITNHFAIEYYNLKRAEAINKFDTNIASLLNSVIESKRKDFWDNKAALIRRVRSYNADRAFKFDLPDDYFGVDRQSFTERASNDGDVIRTW